MQVYGKRTPKDIYDIMKKNKADYIILEDSICLAHTEDGCRLPDIIDFDNGVVSFCYIYIRCLACCMKNCRWWVEALVRSIQRLLHWLLQPM
jgi:hypothetical protein